MEYNLIIYELKFFFERIRVFICNNALQTATTAQSLDTLSTQEMRYLKKTSLISCYYNYFPLIVSKAYSLLRFKYLIFLGMDFYRGHWVRSSP